VVQKTSSKPFRRAGKARALKPVTLTGIFRQLPIKLISRACVGFIILKHTHECKPGN
jgi:hypothetical protein